MTITVRPLPVTTIASQLVPIVSSRQAQFVVASNRADATIQCAIDGGPFFACASPVSYGGLADGSHTFVARSLTLDGVAETSPPAWTWTVDATAPVLTLSSPANGSVFTQGQLIAPAAICTDNGTALSPDLPAVATATVGPTFTYAASCTDGAGNVVIANATYSVVAPPPVVDPPSTTPQFDVRWRSDSRGSTPSTLNGARVSGRITLSLTDAIGTPIGRDRSIRSVAFRIIDSSGTTVLEGSDRWSPFSSGRGHRNNVAIDTGRLLNGAYRIEAIVAVRDGAPVTIVASFDVANAPRRHAHRGWGHDCD
ncbi:MAG: hypothetical protein AB7V43_09135 [Acidimicrobiia bacterium]